MNLRIDDFEGPFDLLLHLVRASKMDIYKVNIKDIIKQYLDFINTLEKEDIDKSSEYLVMASELLRIKSNLLVNKYDEEDSEEEYSINSEEELRERLIEYEKYKNMTDTFRMLEENRLNYYTKLPENLKEYVDDKVVNSEVSINELVKAFIDIQNRMKLKKPISTRVTRREFSVKERIQEIRGLLKEKKRLEFSELFVILTKEYVVVTFLSLLDMSKNKEITLKQDKTFSNIIIESM